MPFTGTAPNKTFSRTDGSRTGTTVWAQAEGAGVDILSADADTHDQDLATAIDSLLLKDGGNQPSADLPMNDKKHTGVADATGRTNYPSMGQVADNDHKYYGDLSGTDTYTVADNGFGPASYHDGYEIQARVVNANTGAATLNKGSVGAADIVLQGDVALTGGELPAGYIATFRYNDDYDAFVIISMLTQGSGNKLDADTVDGVEAADIATGQQTVNLLASGMIARTTNGALSYSTEKATNDVMVSGFEFDASTDQAIQIMFPMPKGWNESTLIFKFYWTTSDTAGTGNVIWGVRARALSNDDAIDGTWGTAVTVTDGFLADGDMHVTAETSALTVGNTPAEEDMIAIEVYRDADDGSDTYNQTAVLLAAMMHYTTNANTDD